MALSPIDLTRGVMTSDPQFLVGKSSERTKLNKKPEISAFKLHITLISFGKPPHSQRQQAEKNQADRPS